MFFKKQLVRFSPSVSSYINVKCFETSKSSMYYQYQKYDFSSSTTSSSGTSDFGFKNVLKDEKENLVKQVFSKVASK